MLAIDLAAIVVVVGLAFFSAAFWLYYRSKKLRGRTAILKEQGKANLLELIAELDRRCYICHTVTGKAGLFLEATGQWCHDVCLTREFNKEKV